MEDHRALIWYGVVRLISAKPSYEREKVEE